MFASEIITKLDKTDFRFGLVKGSVYGVFKFEPDILYAPIKYKNHVNGTACYYSINKKFFSIMVKGGGRYAEYEEVNNYLVDISTNILDSGYKYIFTGDYVQDEESGKKYEVKACPKSGGFYLCDYFSRHVTGFDDYDPENFSLTSAGNYTIVGNRIEGLFNVHES